MTYRLQGVSIEGFRAYGARIEFDCSADVVALVGPNGWGKTSFFDAITWCLFGQIPRLTGTRDFVGAEFVRNRFLPDIPPYVSLSLESDGPSVVLARDTNGLRVVTENAEFEQEAADDWVSELVRGGHLPDEEDYEDEALGVLRDKPESIFLRSHQLSQDQMAAFLRESSPRDRFDTLASLLGLDEIRSFHAHMASVEKELAQEVIEARRQQALVEQRYATVRNELEEIETLATDSSATFDLLVNEFGRLLLEAGEIGLSLSQDETGSTSPSDLADRLRDIVLSLQAFAASKSSRTEELESLQRDSAVLDDAETMSRLTSNRSALDEELVRLGQSLAELESRLAGAREKRTILASRLEEEDQRRQELVAFLVVAERHLTDDRCPLCQQAISLDAVRASVAERLAAQPEVLVSIQREWNDADAAVQQLESEFNRLDAGIQEATQSRASVDYDIVSQANVVEDVRQRLSLVGVSNDASDLPGLLAREARESKLAAREADLLAIRADGLARRATSLASQSRLSRLRDQRTTLQTGLNSTAGEVRMLSTATDLARSVVMAARRSERELVQSMLRSIEPTLDVLYGRLRPHPVLDRLRLDIGSYDERGEIRFVAYSPRAEANVTTIFSSAQLNAVAVCVFLAMNLAVSRSRVSFALLDDPIQNMDDFNVLGLLDLLRGLVGERQFVLSTHDEQIGELLRRKLRPLSPDSHTIVHRFVAYKPEGPVVDVAVDSFVTAESVIQQAASL
jgi:DNA repair exonuclease SbcCD ATPase subunit